MKAFIFGQKWKEVDTPFVNRLLNKLEAADIDFKVFQNYADQLPQLSLDYECLSTHDELKDYSPEVIITLGGDGTILSAVPLIRELEIPIMGLNLGRLGFLASIEQERIDQAIDNFVAGNYTVIKRAMIKMISNPQVFANDNFALNDFTLLKRDNSSMIVLHTFIDGEFLNSYWADGLIVSTPTGSTGYSLSCGGPIIFPSSDNLVLTPVAPHNLNVRPVVISGGHEVSFKIEGRAENFLCSLDSRYEIINSEHEIKLVKNDFSTNLICLQGDNFMKTIRNKLNWGLDKRN
ncbi:MAG: NAD kinase [Saprospiraceae bacterium]|nr:NAD kinase [Bacteroidia bacterium]NNE13378.1 NAD kinase [Saprospiraceae bacterium]NNL91073.1 NAD kinase [Saprospiraceae bacterium]